MSALHTVAVGVLFGAGIYALLARDIVRCIIGLSLISYAAMLFLLAMGHSRGAAPIEPFAGEGPPSDPLVQALILTAIVINAGTTAVMIGFVHRAFETYGTLDQSALSTPHAEEGEEPRCSPRR